MKTQTKAKRPKRVLVPVEAPREILNYLAGYPLILSASDEVKMRDVWRCLLIKAGANV
jgi:hypothetical protein